ncbi:hypothetical protein ABZ339_09655, partial [Streptomyces sp. NPDC005969]
MTEAGMRSMVSGSSGVPEGGKEREPVSGGADGTEGAGGAGAGWEAGADVRPGDGPASVAGMEGGGGSGAGAEARAGSDAALDLVLDLVPGDVTDPAPGAASAKASVSVPASASAPALDSDSGPPALPLLDAVSGTTQPARTDPGSDAPYSTPPPMEPVSASAKASVSVPASASAPALDSDSGPPALPLLDA